MVHTTIFWEHILPRQLVLAFVTYPHSLVPTRRAKCKHRLLKPHFIPAPAPPTDLFLKVGLHYVYVLRSDCLKTRLRQRNCAHVNRHGDSGPPLAIPPECARARLIRRKDIRPRGTEVVLAEIPTLLQFGVRSTIALVALYTCRSPPYVCLCCLFVPTFRPNSAPAGTG